MIKLGVYIHIPFCRRKCSYCDFSSLAGGEEMFADYSRALEREIAAGAAGYSGAIIDTLYFGGGTPSIFPVKYLSGILATLVKNYSVAAGAEISLEANPGTVNQDGLTALRKAGFNRISFGVQSFSDRILTDIGRLHTAGQAMEAVRMARAAGFENVSIDLMYGLPGQSLNSLRQSLRQAVALAVDHISVYGLSVEDGTPLAAMIKQGRVVLPADDEEAEMYDYVTEYLPGQGYDRYEISNYARNGFACRHNRKYWRYQPYLGFGAAAHSFFTGQRLANTAAVKKYIKLVNNNCSPVSFREQPGEAAARAEFIFLGLRETGGFALADFAGQFGGDFRDIYRPTVEKLTRQGLITADEERIRLTRRGMKYGNVVFRAFMP